jgi:DNA-binding NarL/FixJ family response regulator
VNDSERIRVLSIDDHPLVREGIAALINNQADMLLAAQGATGKEAIQLFRDHRPDIVLLDVRLPDMNGIDAMITIRSEFPEARIIVVTSSEGDVEMQRALEGGAAGYIVKSMPPQALVEAIRKVHAGKKAIPPEVAARLADHYGDEELTTREIEILQQVAEGNRNRDIADKLFISEGTVKVHIQHIMAKLGASDRTQAIRLPSAAALSISRTPSDFVPPVLIAKSGISHISHSISEKASYREMPSHVKKPHSTCSEHEDSWTEAIIRIQQQDEAKSRKSNSS